LDVLLDEFEFHPYSRLEILEKRWVIDLSSVTSMLLLKRRFTGLARFRKCPGRVADFFFCGRDTDREAQCADSSVS